jgi:hypothetical protein
VYRLAPIERPSKLPQALVLTTANDQYWIEYRGRPAQNDDGQQTAGAGVISASARAPTSTDSAAPGSRTPARQPGRPERPELRAGDRFRRAARSRSRAQATGPRRRLRFTLDRPTAPRTPRFTAALVGGGLQVTLDARRDAGSGLARFTSSLDRRAPLQRRGDATEEPVVDRQAAAGTHTVTVVASTGREPQRAGVPQVRVQYATGKPRRRLMSVDVCLPARPALPRARRGRVRRPAPRRLLEGNNNGKTTYLSRCSLLRTDQKIWNCYVARLFADIEKSGRPAHELPRIDVKVRAGGGYLESAVPHDDAPGRPHVRAPPPHHAREPAALPAAFERPGCSAGLRHGDGADARDLRSDSSARTVRSSSA